MPQPDMPFGADPVRRAWDRAREQLATVRARLDARYRRRIMLRRLFGAPDAPTTDGRRFFLMLADMAEMGALRIAESDREETARAANRTLINRLIAEWGGEDDELMNLRARERELAEETKDE